MKHIYINDTFICPIEYKQVLAILYLYQIKNIKNPGPYILIKSKKKEAYNIVFTSLYNMLSNNNRIKISLISITIDLERAMNSKKSFNNIRIIRCIFHFSQALRKKLSILYLFKKEQKDIENYILKYFR